jgi:hypothetical protein
VGKDRLTSRVCEKITDKIFSLQVELKGTVLPDTGLSFRVNTVQSNQYLSSVGPLVSLINFFYFVLPEIFISIFITARMKS